MEKEIILLDTSILIDYFRKKDKTKSNLFKLSSIYQEFAVSSITEFEVYTGAPNEQIKIWDDFFVDVVIFPFDSQIA